MTIIHFLKNNKASMATISSLNDLPHPYNCIFEELSQFAFLALKKDQLVFTLAEVKVECPNLNPATLDKLGLWKKAQYFKPQDACDHESFHFLHYSVQEYMAAYYIASLKENELLQLLKETFWNVHYFNTWIMYIGITGGKHYTFTHFLCGNYMKSWIFGPKISNEILNDKIKCLHLLRCSVEADCEMLSSVENIFQEQIIDLSNYNLSVNDIHILAILLLQLPNKEWKKLNLSGCNINDEGCDSVYKIFVSKRVSCKIKTVDLSNNNFQWESLCKLCEVFKLWQTEELVISVDALYDNTTISMINDFKSKLNKSICTRLSNESTPFEILNCTYMEKQNTMVAVYSQRVLTKAGNYIHAIIQPIFHAYLQSMPVAISCLQLSNCSLDHMTISRLKSLAEKTFRFMGMQQINFIYRFDYNEICRKSKGYILWT